MNILVIGGTRFFGIPMVKKLIANGHHVTIATRGIAKDTFGNSVSRLIFDRSDEASIKAAFGRKQFDVVIDKIAYSSNDVRRVLDHIQCSTYILMSSSAVYTDMHADTKESEFDESNYPLKWCERSDADYDEVKRQAECCVAQHYPEQKYIAVRYPVVIGSNDYTNRLRFYVEHIMQHEPMYIDDMHSRISFIHEEEAGLFFAHLVKSDITGAINGCSDGDTSIAEFIGYIENKTRCKAVLSKDGNAAPYNGYPEFATLNTDKAKGTGFQFKQIKDWIYPTIDNIISTL